MALITDRSAVMEAYASAAEREWVVPSFGTENPTTTEAILAGAAQYAQEAGISDVPVTVAITNRYAYRSQAANYTHTGRWDVGMKRFLADLQVCCDLEPSFRKLKVMCHLDHIQPDRDKDLLEWSMGSFSSIMYDASKQPFSENIELTRRFVEMHGKEIAVEGACDEILNAGGGAEDCLTTPEQAERFVTGTGVDFIVANLGTEHRASSTELTYHGDLAAKIRDQIGSKIVLHGTSSVPHEQIRSLFADGVAKVNVWTALERDSTPALFEVMVREAGKHIGTEGVEQLKREGVLGRKVAQGQKACLDRFTTTYRQQVIFDEMKRIVVEYLRMWYGNDGQ